MKLEDQVCSLELSKKLKYLGVKQESLWYWKGGFLRSDESIGEQYKDRDDCYSAFTVAELGEMLPKTIEKDFGLHFLEIQRDYENKWRFQYGINTHFTSLENDTEANARAKMLVYLLENKLL